MLSRSDNRSINSSSYCTRGFQSRAEAGDSKSSRQRSIANERVFSTPRGPWLAIVSRDQHKGRFTDHPAIGTSVGSNSHPLIRSLADDLLGSRLSQADPAWLDSVVADNVKNGALGLDRLGLAQHVEDIVRPDRLPVACTHIHANQDIAFLNGGLGRGTAGQNGLDVQAAPEFGRDRRDPLG